MESPDPGIWNAVAIDSASVATALLSGSGSMGGMSVDDLAQEVAIKFWQKMDGCADDTRDRLMNSWFYEEAKPGLLGLFGDATHEVNALPTKFWTKSQL